MSPGPCLLNSWLPWQVVFVMGLLENGAWCVDARVGHIAKGSKQSWPCCGTIVWGVAVLCIPKFRGVSAHWCVPKTCPSNAVAVFVLRLHVV